MIDVGASNETAAKTDLNDLRAALRTFGLRLLQPIGRGSTGSVYKVIDLASARPYALKILHPTSHAPTVAFMTEFRALTKIRHPNVVRYHQLLELPDTLGIVMEHIEGKTLAMWARSSQFALAHQAPTPAGDEPGIAPGEKWLRDTVGALHHLHGSGIFHGDIKPSNIMLTPQGRPVLIDFGLFRLEDRTDVGLDRGWTPDFGSPDEFLRGASPAADWLALGRVWQKSPLGRRSIPSSSSDAVWLEYASHLTQSDPETRVEASERLAAHWQTPVQTITSRIQAFYARDHELNTLLDAAFEPEGSPMLVFGPPGVGKSLLIEQLKLSLCEEDIAVFTASCERRMHVAYPAVESLVEGLADLIRRQMIDIRHHCPRSYASHLMRAFPIFKEFLDTSNERDESHTDEQTLVEALAWLVRFCGGSQCVLVVDDLQWMDHHSLAFSRRVLRVLGSDSPKIIATLRWSAHDEPSPWLDLFDRHLELKPLSQLGIRQIAQGELCDSQDPRIDLIVELATGNPLFARVLSRLLREQPRQATEALTNVERALDAQFQRLSDAASEMLRLVSIAGRPTSMHIMADAIPDHATDAALAELSVQGLITTLEKDGHEIVRPTHDLIASTMNKQLTREESIRYHACVAASGTRTGLLDDIMIADHLWHADRPMDAAAHLCAAGDKALKRGRTSQALTHFERAKQAYVRSATQVPTKLLRIMADTHERLHNLEDAIKAYRELADSSEILEAARGERRALELNCLRGQVPDMDAAFASLFQQRSVRWSSSRLHIFCSALWGRLEIRQPRAELAASTPEGIDSTLREHAELLASAFVSYLRRDFLRALELHNRYLRAAEACADPVQMSVAYAVEAGIRTLEGSQDAALMWLESSRALADSSEDPTGDLDVIVRYAEGIYLFSFVSARVAAAHLEQALDIQSSQNTQNAQTRDQTRIALLQLWFEQGLIHNTIEVSTRTSHAALQRRDILTKLTLDVLVSTEALLAVDSVDEARACADQAMQITAQQPAFRALRYIAHRARLLVGLYEDEVGTALRNGPPIDRTLLMDAWDLTDVDRVRYFEALGHACHRMATTETGLRRWKWLIRSRVAWLRCRGRSVSRAELTRLSLAASRAALAGQHDSARTYRAAAAELADTLEQTLHTQLQRLCAGSPQALEALYALGVAKPHQLARALCGQPSPSAPARRPTGDKPLSQPE